MEKVADDTLVSVDVFVPSLLRSFLITLAIGISLLNVWLFVFFVKIFCHEVQNCIDTFLRVVLSISLKGDIILSKNSFEEIRSNNLVAVFPHFCYEFSPSLDKSTLCSKRVLDFFFDQ
jgi:hypothetical protein